MDDTGRIKQPATPTARRVLFQQPAALQIQRELPSMVAIDRAHLVMLTECGIMRVEHASRLLNAIDELRQSGFVQLHGRPAHRGVYLLYEDYLIQAVGIEAAGMLQTGRSRNDLGATVLKLRARQCYVSLMREALRLQAVLLVRAKRYAQTVMPAYTHFQAAMPSTFGHYLGAVAQAMSRDLDGLESAIQGIHSSPLGAGAVAGTTLPIDSTRTARLLGFREPVLNSIDAVASRDLVLRILGACAIYSVTLSRLAADLLQWSTAEFGFLELPDNLCGSSSAMPQKRNPFLLEHVLGRATASAAAFVQSAMSMHAMPFTNSIAVGTEAVRTFWDTIQCACECTILTRLVVAGAQPNTAAMRARVETGYTSATELANRLVLQGGMDFRTAHRVVGEIVRKAISEGGKPFEESARDYLQGQNKSLDLGGLDAASLVEGACAGGGPAAVSVSRCIRAAQTRWKARVSDLKDLQEFWRQSEKQLDMATEALQSCHG
jgi:argininosuccinate lyase